MKRPDTILDEIHATRRKIDEQTQGMTAAERTAYFNQVGEDVAHRYGLNRIVNAKESARKMKKM
jgi:hypothetical protein